MFGINRYTLLYIDQINIKDLLYSIGKYTQYPGITYNGEKTEKEYLNIYSGPQWLSHVRLFGNPMDCSLPGATVHGISQATILQWVSISSFRGSSQPRDQNHVSSWQAESLLLSHLGSLDIYESPCCNPETNTTL